MQSGGLPVLQGPDALVFWEESGQTLLRVGVLQTQVGGVVGRAGVVSNR